MLQVIRALKEEFTIPIGIYFWRAMRCLKASGLRQRICHMIDEALPVVANEGLADYVDAFCEKGYFGLEETQSLLDAAASHGIKSKAHVNQFNAFGGVKLCVNSNAVSVTGGVECGGCRSAEVRRGFSNPPSQLRFQGALISWAFRTQLHELMRRTYLAALATDFNRVLRPRVT